MNRIKLNRKKLVIFIGLLLFAAAVDARAAPPPKAVSAEELHEAAKTAFNRHDYGRAAELFMKEHNLSKRPGPVYNAARAREAGGKLAEAKALFELYLQIEPNAEGIADGKMHLAAVEAALLAEANPPPVLHAVKEPETQRSKVILPQPIHLPKAATETALPKDVTADSGSDTPAAPKKFPTVKVITGASFAVAALVTYLAARADVTQAVNALPAHTDAERQQYLSTIGYAQGLRGMAIGFGAVSATLLTWAGFEWFRQP